MGYDTQLLFNCIEVPQKQLMPLRDSAREALSDEDCPWSYMLENLYLMDPDDEIIDLQISKEITKQLKSRFPKQVKPLDKIAKEDDDDLWYHLRWDPADDPNGKWYDTEGFARWLAAFCRCGHLFQMTNEDNGGLWGWEFQDGRICELERIHDPSSAL